MPFFDLEDRLEDIRDAISDIETFIAGKSFDGYMDDKLCRRAVERSVGIISEASRHIPDEQKSRHTEIPWGRVAGIGNVLGHGYKQVRDEEIWRIANQELPTLKSVVEDMLREARAPHQGP